MPSFKPSHFGEPVVVWEEENEQFSLARLAFSAITAISGVLLLIFVLFRLVSFLPKPDPRARIVQRVRRLMVWLFAAYAVHLGIHVGHYADNIFRPIDYFEPEWLYKGYVMSTMEITFFANWPIVIGGAICVDRLLSSMKSTALVVDGDSKNVDNARFYSGLATMAYAATSILTLLHYTVEPPTSYSVAVNFTIAGEGVASAVLVAAVLMCIRTRCERTSSSVVGLEMEEIKSKEEKDEVRPNQLRRRSREVAKAEVTAH